MKTKRNIETKLRENVYFELLSIFHGENKVFIVNMSGFSSRDLCTDIQKRGTVYSCC